MIIQPTIDEQLWMAANGKWTVIFVGHTLSTKDEIIAFDGKDGDINIFTHERFLPKILVDAGFFKSNGEIRRQRSDLVHTFPDNEFSFHIIRIAKNGANKNKCIAIWVGTKDETARNKAKDLIAINS